MNRFEQLFDDLRRYIGGYGVRVPLKTMDIEKPGEFDGLTITINPVHDAESRSYYLAHAFGSIIQWSTDFKMAKNVFRELRTAVAGRRKDPERFEKALEAYRRFEETSSEHAVWLLEHIGHRAAVRAYTMFFRADLEAMTIFHRTGHSPRWQDFYTQWKRRVKRVKPFAPRSFGRFAPVRIEQQEVVQERD